MNSQMPGASGSAAQQYPLTPELGQVESGVQRTYNLSADIQQKIALLEQRLVKVLREEAPSPNPPVATGHGNLTPLPRALVPLAYEIAGAIGTLGDCQTRLLSILERLEL